MPAKIPDDKYAAHFWAKVETRGADECWHWTESTSDDGYGFVRKDRKTKRAHRVAWELTNGDIPDGMKVLHKCDNPPCCNPNHLFLGTDQDNSDDKMKKGRFIRLVGDRNGSRRHPEARPRGENHWMKRLAYKILRGERNGRARLTEAQVLEIRAERANGEKYSELSKKFGISKTQIARIVKGESWDLK